MEVGAQAVMLTVSFFLCQIYFFKNPEVSNKSVCDEYSQFKNDFNKTSQHLRYLQSHQ